MLFKFDSSNAIEFLQSSLDWSHNDIWYIKAVTEANIPIYQQINLNDITPKCRKGVPTLTKAVGYEVINFAPDRELTEVLSTEKEVSAYFANSNSDCILEYSVVDQDKRGYQSGHVHFGVLTIIGDSGKIEMKQDPIRYNGGDFTAYLKVTSSAVDGKSNENMILYTKIEVTEFIAPCKKGVKTLMNQVIDGT